MTKIFLSVMEIRSVGPGDRNENMNVSLFCILFSTVNIHPRINRMNALLIKFLHFGSARSVIAADVIKL